MSNIPQSMPYIEDAFDQYTERDKWIKLGMFAFVCWNWITPFIKWINNRKCLEVMAGAGWLTKALREKGVSIISTDNNSWKNKQAWDNVTDIMEMDAVEAIVKYGKVVDILIISWPYMDDTAFRCIQAAYTMNPDILIVYIGEGCGGCTANDQFFENFSEIDDPIFELASNKFKSWFGLHDNLILGQFKIN